MSRSQSTGFDAAAQRIGATQRDDILEVEESGPTGRLHRSAPAYGPSGVLMRSTRHGGYPGGRGRGEGPEHHLREAAGQSGIAGWTRTAGTVDPRREPVFGEHCHEMVQSITSPDRYPRGAVDLIDTQLFANTLSAHLQTTPDAPNPRLSSWAGDGSDIARRVARYAPRLTRADLLRVPLPEQVQRFGISFDEALTLRRASPTSPYPTDLPRSRNLAESPSHNSQAGTSSKHERQSPTPVSTSAPRSGPTRTTRSPPEW